LSTSRPPDRDARALGRGDDPFRLEKPVFPQLGGLPRQIVQYSFHADPPLKFDLRNFIAIKFLVKESKCNILTNITINLVHKHLGQDFVFV
jgi:hypothetical protein